MGQIFNRERAFLVMALLSIAAVVVQLGFAPERRGRPFGASTPKAGITIPHFFKTWRERFLESARPTDHLGLVRGMFLGEDRYIPAPTKALYRKAGLSHLLAASGYNCWIVSASFALMISALALSLSTNLSTDRWLRMRSLGPPLSRVFGAWLFWLWTDQSPPITRAVGLITGRVALDWLGLGASFVRLLIVQYAASLLVAPALWRSASFQLTFGCLFGMVLVPRAVRGLRPERHSSSLLLLEWDYFWTNLGATLGTIPTTWLVFGEANFMGIATNWLVTLPVGLVVMPAALLLMLLSMPGLPQLEPLNHALGWIAAATAELLTQAIRGWINMLPSLRF